MYINNIQYNEELKNKSEEIIESIFSKIFKNNNQLGRSIYIIGKNPISQKINKNLSKYLSENSNEKPLLVFDYEKELEEGFIITNKRFVWYFKTDGKQEIELLNIKDVLFGKFFLADVINIVSIDNIKYKNIYITGMEEKEEFILKFREFINCINQIFLKDYSCEKKYSDYNTDYIIKACKNVVIKSSYCEVGNPIILKSSSKKYTNARANYKIPKSEDIFLIYDSTVFGTCKKGFAICTTGLYYNDKEVGYIEWKDFKNMTLSYGITGLKIGKTISFITDKDAKNLIKILKYIQEYVNKTI